MQLIHELSSDSVESVLRNGLKRTSRGDKGSDTAIMKTDRLLDERCPAALKNQGISRDDNVYAYVLIDNFVVDITSGEPVSMQDFIAQSDQAVIAITVDPRRCFVSDLDTYDALKDALETHQPPQVIDKLVKSYWNKIIPLPRFTHGDIRRPEVMVTYDIEPTHLERLT